MSKKHVVSVGNKFMDLTPGSDRVIEILEVNGFKAKARNVATGKITSVSISRIVETDGGRGWRPVE